MFRAKIEDGHHITSIRHYRVVITSGKALQGATQTYQINIGENEEAIKNGHSRVTGNIEDNNSNEDEQQQKNNTENTRAC
jgi:hypothetical protein